MTLVLDISRSVARAWLPVRSGIDRVERAHAGWALRREALFLCEVGGRLHLLDAGAVAELLTWLDGDGPAPARDAGALLRPWRDRRLARAQSAVRRASLAQARADDARATAAMLRRALPDGGVYLNVGHENLSAAVMDGTGAAGLARAVLIHDVMPLDHPEFAGPGAPERFRSMLRAVTRADLILCNSRHTAERLRMALRGELPPMVVAPLGVETPARIAAAGQRAYFLCLGTIEPRKNHALLLEVWERLAVEPAAAPPVLRIVGRRGWCGEALFRRLDAAAAGGAVAEHGALDDAGTAALLSGARALLFPSLAEGFGLPLAEALAAGVPVIASDLPALREVGGDVPDWLSPRDLDAWRRAVLDYAAEPSPRREAQMTRLADWRAPGWQAHFAILENALETILVQPRGGG